MSNSHKLDAHVFICTNKKELGQSCQNSGSMELREKIKKYCQAEESGLHGKVRINTAGCLGRCEKGIAAVIYPQGKWLENLKLQDDKVVIEAILAAVKR
jgi:(2Fe-2S) ferredoxin